MEQSVRIDLRPIHTERKRKLKISFMFHVSFIFFACCLIFFAFAWREKTISRNYVFVLSLCSFFFFTPNDALAKALQYLKLRYYEGWLCCFFRKLKVSVYQRFRCIVQIVNVTVIRNSYTLVLLLKSSA